MRDVRTAMIIRYEQDQIEVHNVRDDRCSCCRCIKRCYNFGLLAILLFVFNLTDITLDLNFMIQAKVTPLLQCFLWFFFLFQFFALANVIRADKKCKNKVGTFSFFAIGGDLLTKEEIQGYDQQSIDDREDSR